MLTFSMATIGRLLSAVYYVTNMQVLIPGRKGQDGWKVFHLEVDGVRNGQVFKGASPNYFCTLNVSDL